MDGDAALVKIFGLLDVLSFEVGSMRSDFGKRFDRLEGRFDGLTVEARVGFERIDRRLGNIETRVENIETRVENIEPRVMKVEQRIVQSPYA